MFLQLCIIIPQEEADEDYQIGSLFTDEEEKAGQSSTPNFPSYERKALKSDTGTGILNQFLSREKTISRFKK